MPNSRQQSGPELSVPTLEYVAQTYVKMMDWIEGKGDPPFETEGIDVPMIPIPVEELADQVLRNEALGSCLAVDALATGLKITFEGEISDPAELDRRSKLGELMVKGLDYYVILSSQGEEVLMDPEKPYSPKLVAAFVSSELPDMMGFREISDVQEFIAGFNPHE